MTNENREETIIGIDVGKQYLDVAQWGSTNHWQVANDEKGITDLVNDLLSLSVTLVVVEASGGLEMPVVTETALAGVPVSVANPPRIRAFA